MVNYDDYFGNFYPQEYEQQTKENFEYLDNLSKVNYEKSYSIIDKFKSKLFSLNFVSNEEAEMLYQTIINWKEKSDLYDYDQQR